MRVVKKAKKRSSVAKKSASASKKHVTLTDVEKVSKAVRKNIQTGVRFVGSKIASVGRSIQQAEYEKKIPVVYSSAANAKVYSNGEES